jgi:hypothetical protein
MKSILDPSFRYTASFDTDLHRTFAKVRSEHRKTAMEATRLTADALARVTSIVGMTATARS